MTAQAAFASPGLASPVRLPHVKIKKRVLVFFALLGCAGAVLSSDKIVFLFPDAIVSLRSQIKGRVRAAGLLSSMPFDGPFLYDWAGDIDVEEEHTRSVAGASGDARRFHGSKAAAIGTAALWSLLGDSYSVLLRIRFKENSPRTQEVCQFSSPQGPIGFSWEDGFLRFRFQADGGVKLLETEVRRPSNWHSFLVTADSGSRLVRLYDNGVLVAETQAVAETLPRGHIFIGKAQWHPLFADVDEFDIWDRPLRPREIRAVSRRSFSASRHYAPRQDLQLRAATLASRLLPAAVRTEERLARAASFRSASVKVPVLAVHLSSADQRHLSVAHENAMRSGTRTEGGARLRNCRFSTARGMVDGRFCLDNPYVFGNRVRKPAYIAVADFDGDGVQEHVRLFPPEEFPLFHPGYDQERSLLSMSFVHLSVNGAVSGLYCIEPFQRNGESWVLDMAFYHPGSPLRKNPQRPFDLCDLLPAEEQNRRRGENLDLILSDPSSVWSRREWANIRKEASYAAARRGFPPVSPSALNALGANLAPFLVTTNLDLADPTLAQIRRWESSRPDVVSEGGGICRPEGDVPVRATLTGYDKKDRPCAKFEFRVMPERPRLPVLMLYLAIPPTKVRRSDFTALYFPAGGGEARRLSGFVGNGGGIKARGNTSFVKGVKKPFSLKFDEPHGIFGPEGDRGLYLFSSYGDSTRLRSRLCYDVFRSFHTPGAPCIAPQVSWIEVFVNGEYYGVFEMCSRVKAPAFANESSIPELFKVKAETPVFAEVSARAFAQELPNIEDSCRVDSVNRLMAAVVGRTPDDFVKAVDENFYLANLIDFYLLVNFTDNEDGRVTNFILAHETSGEGRYYFIPWDYDKTFRPDIKPRDLANSLFSKMNSKYPGHVVSVYRRWRELRSGPLADSTLFAKIDADAGFLAPYMPFEYENLGWKGVRFEDEVQVLRDMVRRNLDYMDGLAKKHLEPK